MHYYKIIQIVRALRLAIKPFYMSVCKHGFHSESSRGVLPAIYLAVTQFLWVCFEYSNGRRRFS